MNNWWVELYTIPNSKTILRAWGIVFLLTLVLIFFLPDYLMLTGWANGYILYVAKRNSKKTFGANIEFHKLHIPFVELRAAYFKDAFITGVLIFTCCSLNVLLAASFTHAVAEEQMLGLFMLGYFSFAVMASVNLNTLKNGKMTYQLLNSEMNQVLHFLIIMGVGLVVTMAALVGMVLQFHLVSIAPAMILTGILAYTIFLFRSVFHQEVIRGNLKVFSKYLFQGSVASLGLYLVFTFVTRPLINVSSVHPEMRNIFFLSSGPFAPELDLETGKELFVMNSFELQAQAMIFDHTPGLTQVPVSELILKPSSIAYHDYMSANENPTKENMLYMLEKMSKMKQKSSYVQSTSQLIVHKWPKGEKFPEEYLVKVETTKDRIPANEED